MSDENDPQSENAQAVPVIVAMAMRLASQHLLHFDECPAVAPATPNGPQPCSCGADRAQMDLASKIVQLVKSPHGATYPPGTRRLVLTAVVLADIPELVGSKVRYTVLVQPGTGDAMDQANGYQQLAKACQVGIRQLTEGALLSSDVSAAMARKGG